jgi:hypothetical protein
MTSPAAVPSARAKSDGGDPPGVRAERVHDPVIAKKTGLPRVAPASTRTVSPGISGRRPSHATRCSA